MEENKEFEKLKLWLDSELSINHCFYWAILGAIIGGKFWYIAGTGILLSLIYAFRRLVKVPPNYLKLPKKRLR
jgi:membrane protein DedA with SNARE-associated domain